MHKLNIMLEEERLKRGWDKKQCAKMMGIIPDTYRKYEKGTRQPDLDTLVKMADFYKTSTDYLLGRYTQ